MTIDTLELTIGLDGTAPDTAAIMDPARACAARLRAEAIRRLIQREKRNAALDALVESGKSGSRIKDVPAYVGMAIQKRCVELLDCRLDLGGDWPGYLLSQESVETYGAVLGSDAEIRATYEALDQALRETWQEFS